MKTGPSRNVDRMIVTPMDFAVPLDWNNPGETISVHAKLVVAVEKQDDNLPYLCRFEGGPGFEATRPIDRSGHLRELLKRYRVVLLDERGTGLSTPVDGPSFAGREAHETAAYLRNFRADSIVRDAEHIREGLGLDKWTILGHSYGGFIALTYLSFAQESLSEAIILAGFAPVLHTADDVYLQLADVVAERNVRFFAKYPEDVDRVARIYEALRQGDQLVDGFPVTAEQFQMLGNRFGRKHGLAHVHDIIERAATDLDQLGRLSQHTLRNIFDVMHFDTNPIYAILHESIYNQGSATKWSAARVLKSRAEFALDRKPYPYFSGEMVVPEMFEVKPSMQPLRDAAHILADYEDWGPLYDPDALRANTAPVVGTIAYDDLYVWREYALETAKLVGNCSYWITNEHEHQAYADEPERVMTRIYEMLDEKRG